MAYVRLTWLQPRPGSESEVCSLLYELDEKLSQAAGLLSSLVIVDDARVGRVSLWTSKADANREAVSDSNLSLRSRLRYLSLSAEESMLEVASAQMTQSELRQLLSSKAPRLKSALSS